MSRFFATYETGIHQIYLVDCRFILVDTLVQFQSVLEVVCSILEIVCSVLIDYRKWSCLYTQDLQKKLLTLWILYN